MNLYESADCSGSPAATGTASAFNSPGLTVSVLNGSDTEFTATATDAAGNTSDCSSPFTYTACTANPVVTSTGDDGPGTLREAIVNACSVDSIAFDIPGTGPHTIVLESELYLDKDLTITGPSDERVVISGGGTTTIVAVDFFATVTLDRLNFENGFGDFEGGAIENFGVLTVRNSSITGSTGVVGAAICNEGTVTVEFTTITGNIATDAGGGLYNAGTMTVRNSTVSGNTSEVGPGGGLLSDIFAETSITNTTISGNTAVDVGGGVANGPEAIMSLTHVTITANHSDLQGGGTANFGDLTVTNSVIAGNTATDSDPDHFEDCPGTTTETGINVRSGNPHLGPLQNNGGPTLTHAPLSNSPLLDAGDNAATSTASLTTDQRGTGFARVRDDGDVNTTQTVDIGAFEADPAVQDITDKSTNEDTPLTFTFHIGDGASAFDSVTATSGNALVLTNGGIAVGADTASSRTLTLTPVANASGATTVTVTVTKTAGGAEHGGHVRADGGAGQ